MENHKHRFVTGKLYCQAWLLATLGLLIVLLLPGPAFAQELGVDKKIAVRTNIVPCSRVTTWYM